MDWFLFQGVIKRKTFVVRLLVIWLVSISVFYLASNMIQQGLGIKAYFISKSIAELLIILLCLPSLVKRLRDIGWSIHVAGLFVLAGIFSVRNYSLFGLYVADNQFISITALLPGLAINLASLLVLLVLIFKRGSTGNGNAFQP